jgi:hypothetical protein
MKLNVQHPLYGEFLRSGKANYKSLQGTVMSDIEGDFVRYVTILFFGQKWLILVTQTLRLNRL